MISICSSDYFILSHTEFGKFSISLKVSFEPDYLQSPTESSGPVFKDLVLLAAFTSS